MARLAGIRLRQQLAAGQPGPEGSAAKLVFARLNQDITEFEVELAGADGLRYDDWSMRRPQSTQTSTAASPGTGSCGPRATRSRAGPPRSCATSWPSGCSGCRPRSGWTRTSHGRTCRDEPGDRGATRVRPGTGRPPAARPWPGPAVHRAGDRPARRRPRRCWRTGPGGGTCWPGPRRPTPTTPGCGRPWPPRSAARACWCPRTRAAAGPPTGRPPWWPRSWAGTPRRCPSWAAR